MKWMRFLGPDGAAGIGIVHDGNVHVSGRFTRLEDVIGLGQDSAQDAGQETFDAPHAVLPVDSVIPAAPVSPPSVRDAMCFHEHIRNGFQTPTVAPLHHEFPTFYFSNPAGILSATEQVPLTPGTNRFDYELEVALVIGLAGYNIAPSEAAAHVGGYVVFCDWSARDIQVEEMSLRLGPAKGKDGATSLGPFLVTPEELEPYRSGKGYDLEMTAHVNGDLTSHGNWSSIDWNVSDVIAYASRGTRLRTGDVIGLGTVGNGSLGEQRVQNPDTFRGFLREGDSVRISVEKLGTIETEIGAAPTLHPLSSGH